MKLNGIDSAYIYNFIRGQKSYELSNHLGNVLVTISDKKIGAAPPPCLTCKNTYVPYFMGDVVSATDYSSYGTALEGRQFNADAMATGFNGQRKEQDIQKDHYTAMYWEYDSRIGRRWNLDVKPTVGISEYSTFNGNPILFSDPLGDTSRPGFLGGVQDFGQGGWKAIKKDVKGLAELRHLETWSEMGKNLVALTIGGAGGPANGIPNLLAFDAKYGTDFFDRNAAIASQVQQSIDNIPNMNAKDWGGFTGHIAFAVAGTKGLNLAGEGVSYLGGFSSAEKYLQAVGYTKSFEQGTAKFSFKFGSKNYVYHMSEDLAMGSKWATPSSFYSPSEAFVKSALDYKSLYKNFADYKFSLKNWGVYVKGTASEQGITGGGATQLLKTPFSLKTNFRPLNWWQK